MTYETNIGLEVHVELATASKIFCACPTAFGQTSNTQCCPVCLGLPGALPVLNRSVVTFALRACLATGCMIAPVTRFDRKNYFYPDLPKAYQISQLHQPIGSKGQLTLPGTDRVIRIREIHMEEDAGKLIHDPWDDITCIDYNRCGVPLLEIVSQPDLQSAEETLVYMETLRSILLFLGVSDCRMQEGSLRADVNVSVRPAGHHELGTRTEMKNMNSFKAIGRAIDFERRRQIELLETGQQVRQETRRWDENKDASMAMRSKEDAQDYRYFPDPDLVGIVIDDAWLQSVRDLLPELPEQKKQRYRSDFGLTVYEADLLTTDPALADLFEQTTVLCGRAKETASWVMGEYLQCCKDRSCRPDELQLPAKTLATIIERMADGVINRTVARQVFLQVLDQGVDPDDYITKQGLRMVADPDALQILVQEVLAANPQSVQDYRAGKKKAIGFLIGQVMQRSKGKADPQVVASLLQEALT